MNALKKITMAIGLFGVIAASHAMASQPIGTPTISKERAAAIALSQVKNGKIKKTELENEKNALVWSFDISTPGTKTITEVLVNAKTGAIVEISKESSKHESKEEHDED